VGAAFVKSFGKQEGATPNPYAAYGAQAMDVALEAIAKGNGQRAATTKSVFGLTVTNGILGTFTINSSGDTSQGTITIYKQVGTSLNSLKPIATLTPTSNIIG
jgi:ABC-type branched-subunit amino acid transport system substrate-binding protein